MKEETYQKLKNEELSAQDCALLLCILGTPAANGKRTYPSVEESLSYIQTGKFKGSTKDMKINTAIDDAEVEVKQLSFEF